MNGSHGLVLKNKKLLLVKRRDYPLWVLPGGGLDKGESPEHAVIREVLEETGFHVKVARRVRTYTIKKHRKSYLYKCNIVGGKATLSRESKEVHFFETNNLPDPRDPRIDAYLAALDNPSNELEKIPSLGHPFTLLRFAIRYPILTSRFLLTKIGIHINT